MDIFIDASPEPILKVSLVLVNIGQLIGFGFQKYE